MLTLKWPICLSCTLSVLSLSSGLWPAFGLEDNRPTFYQGKTIDLLVGYPTGGSNDIYSRILGENLGRFIPGNPRVFVRNMPGAGSLVAANYIYNTAPRDGTILGAVSAGIPLEAKLGNAQSRYKASDFNWIGRISRSPSVTMVWKDTQIRKFTDAILSSVTLSATGTGSTGGLYPNIMNKLLNTRFKLVRGYEGTNAAMLAMERGEVEGHSTTWEAVKSVHPAWISSEKIRVLVQHGLTRARDLPEVPTSVELTDNLEDKEVMQVIMSASEIGKSYFTTPGVLPERVSVLRTAFNRVLHDPKFASQIEAIRGEVEPLSGETVQKMVDQLDYIPDKILMRARTVYSEQ